MNQTKIYGQYPGSLSHLADYLNSCKENELFLIVSNILVTHKTKRQELENRKLGKKTMPETTEELKRQLVEDTYAASYALNQTKRFGLNVEISSDNPMPLDGDVTKWTKWWYDHINSKEYTKEEIKAMTELVKQGKSIPDFRPAGTWQEEVYRVSK
ncbi:MAG: hypothetical protein ACOXZS_00655 [Bacilli bacterium]|jgi:hypothetical protein